MRRIMSATMSECLIDNPYCVHPFDKRGEPIIYKCCGVECVWRATTRNEAKMY